MKQYLIILSALLLLTSVVSAQAPTIDGNLCETSGPWLTPNAIDVCNDVTPGTADLASGRFYEMNGIMYVGIERCATGAGTSMYAWRFDFNCDGLADGGITVNWSPNGSQCVDTKNLVLRSGSNSLVIGTAYTGSPSCPSGGSCPNAGLFLEYSFDIQAVIDQLIAWNAIDPCNCTCNSFRFLDFVSLAGGSLNSPVKDQYTTLNFTYSKKINDCPVANFTASPLTGCRFTPIFFDATSSYDTYPLADTTLSFNWNLGDGNTSTSDTVTHTYAADGNYTVTLTVTDTFNCVSTESLTIWIDSILCVTFLPVKIIDFNAVANGNIININWKSAIEQANVTYELLGSTDGFNYSTVCHKQATTSSNNNYNCIFDAANTNFPYYYFKLKMKFDNKVSYYQKIVKVLLSKQNNKIVYNKTDLSVLYPSYKKLYVTIYNDFGKVVFNKLLVGDEKLVNTQILPKKKFYFIKLSTENEQLIETKKMFLD